MTDSKHKTEIYFERYSMKKVINLYNPIINIQTYILTANDHIEKIHKKTHEKKVNIHTSISSMQILLRHISNFWIRESQPPPQLKIPKLIESNFKFTCIREPGAKLGSLLVRESRIRSYTNAYTHI